LQFLASMTNKSNGAGHGASWAFVGFCCAELLFSIAAFIATVIHNRNNEDYVPRGPVDSIKHHARSIKTKFSRNKKGDSKGKKQDQKPEKVVDDGIGEKSDLSPGHYSLYSTELAGDEKHMLQ